MDTLPVWTRWVDFVAQVVAAIAVPLLAWYAYDTMKLRRATEQQARHALTPVLKLQFDSENGEITLRNLGPGVAARALLQPIRYLDSAGGKVDCHFRDLFMVHSLRPEPLRAEITRVDPITEITLRKKGPGGMTVVDLAPSRLKDLILAAGYKTERFIQLMYFTDIVGRVYRVPVTWEHPSIQTRILNLSHPEPITGAPEEIDGWPKTIEPLEIKGESLVP